MRASRNVHVPSSLAPALMAAGVGALLLVPFACSSGSDATDDALDGSTGVAADGAILDGGVTGDQTSPALGDGSVTDSTTPVVVQPPGAACRAATPSKTAAQGAAPDAPSLTVPSGFKLEGLAMVSGARQLAILPNGDLLVSSQGSSIYIVPGAERDGLSAEASVFATFPEGAAQGLVFDPPSCTIYVATQHSIFALPYADGQMTAKPGAPIATVRGGATAGTDGDNHMTTSLGFAGGKLYAGVGSSCNACTETDPTRASVQVMNPDGSNMATRATRFRNAIAITTNPVTGTLWAGGAGQDSIGLGHPFEFIDPVTSHGGVADYGWPACEENHIDYIQGSDCKKTVQPAVELPAYSTLIGATFYSPAQTGKHVFPSNYLGGLFISAHGSWHGKADGTPYSPPRVAFVAMNGDAPVTPVNWSDPSKQWTEFLGGLQDATGARFGRTTGIAVGTEGSLFVADDDNGEVYRIRPM